MKLSDELRTIANKVNEEKIQCYTNTVVEYIHKQCLLVAKEGNYQLSVYITEISAKLHSLDKDYTKCIDQVNQNVLKRLQENFTECSYCNDSYTNGDDDSYILIKW